MIDGPRIENVKKNYFSEKEYMFGAFVMLLCFAAMCAATYTTTELVAVIFPNKSASTPVSGEEKFSENTKTELRASKIEDPILSLEYVHSPRIIDALSIEDVVHAEGKVIVADLQERKIKLYLDGLNVANFPITTFGRPGTPWETPSGLYSIHTKEELHFSSIGKVYMPFSMQFYGNYFIHGRTYHPDGTLTSPTFSGGCIRLETADAQKVFAFSDVGSKVFVYDPKNNQNKSSLLLNTSTVAPVGAQAYLVADLETGDVFGEREAGIALPIASLTKLMTALVANETISFNKSLTISERDLKSKNIDSASQKSFVVGDLMYPLLMSSSDAVALSLASYYGQGNFVRWMNNAADAYNMKSTSYVEPTGISDGNLSTANDLFRLANYILNKKSFIFDITGEKTKVITSNDGSAYEIVNLNESLEFDPYVGGMAGFTTSQQDVMLSLLRLKIGAEKRTIVIVVLGSKNAISDSGKLADWITEASASGAQKGSACVTCATQNYRKIDLP